MKPGESFEIQALDRVISGRDSLARIIWPDGSLSRIGGVTELSIRELSVEHDLSSSHIEIDLER